MKRPYNNHDYKVRVVKNPHKAGGGAYLLDVPFISGWREKKVSDTPDGMVIFDNDWIVTGNGTKILTRTDFDKYDIVEVWKDGAIDFSGLVVGQIKNKDAVNLKLIGHTHRLKKQLVATESYTEEPATTVKRMLKGWTYSMKDNFNRSSLGDDWAADDGTPEIVSNKLRLSGTESVSYTTQIPAIDNFVISAFVEISALENTGIFYIKLNGGAAHNVVLSFYGSAVASSYWHITSPAANYAELYVGIVSGAWSGNIKIISGVTDSYMSFMSDGVLYLSVPAAPMIATTLEIYAETTSGATVDIDFIDVKTLTQIISEGTISNYGSSTTTTTTYETKISTIAERICKQLASTDALNTNWEWVENPIAHDTANPTNPHASLDFKERIGTNQVILLSQEEANITGDSALDVDYAGFNTSVTVAGAGTSGVDGIGQISCKEDDYDAYDEVGLVLEEFKDFSDETELVNLRLLADVYLDRTKTVQENISADPISYDAAGFSIGDGYLLDVEKLATDASAYARILTEKVEFSSSGAEQITVNWQYNSRSFRRELIEWLRNEANRRRYEQGTYITLTVPVSLEIDVAALADGETRYLKLGSDLYQGTKAARYNVEVQTVELAWSLEIDNVDRTTDIYGTATVTGHKYNIDITPYVNSLESHTINTVNKHDVTTQSFRTWGEAQIYIR